MNISQVSDATGLPQKTIRYYEEIGLVHPKREANGYRVFQDVDMHNLAFLARARSLGFPIDMCRSLLALYADQDRASADVKEIAQTHMKVIRQKQAELAAMQETLGRLIDSCAGDSRPDCPILQGLGGAVAQAPD